MSNTYHPEVHDTIEELEILEKLDFQLRITETEYRSKHELTGEIRAFARPNDDAVRNRKHPPRNLIGRLTGGMGPFNDGAGEGFPGTKLYLGVTRIPPFKQDDEAFREGMFTEGNQIEGIPENGTVELDLDWETDEAERMRSESNAKRFTKEYEITDFPSDLLPIVVRAELYPDAREMLENRAVLSEGSMGGRSPQSFTGEAALSIEIELRENDVNDPDVLQISDFRLDMSSTLRQSEIKFIPRENATYNPEQQRIEWSNDKVWSGERTHFMVTGPIDRLLDMGDVTAKIRGQINDYTLSGTKIEGLFDQSGEPLPSERRPDAKRSVNFTGSVEIDPEAIRGEAQKVSRSSISVSTTPQYLYERLTTICEREGIEIRTREPPGDPEPVPGREGVFTVNEEEGNHGELDVKREFGDRGIVYASMTITGEYTATSRETEVSAFDESEDRLVRSDEGALDTRGESTIEIRSRSASSELNSEFIGIVEEGVSGGDL